MELFKRWFQFIYIPSLPPQKIKVKGYFLDEGGRNKDESLHVFSSPATYFNLLYPTLPTQVKVKRWKSERVFLDEGWKNKDESWCAFLSPATYFYLLCPTLPT